VRANPASSRCPFLVRLSGLPASALELFASRSCARDLATGERVRADLARMRAELVDHLYALIGDAPPALRRLLLAVKRDAFAGRELGKHRGAPEWPALLTLAGPLIEGVLALETILERWHLDFARRHHWERDRERHWLHELLTNPSLRRGIALASPVLAAGLERQSRTAAAGIYGRKQRKLDASLLRYVSRSACKLSPFSTFTRLALGEVADLAASAPLRLYGSGWRERSLLRLRRYLIEQDLALLLRYPPFRAGLRVGLSSTLEETSPGRYRFVRPESWQPDPVTGEMHTRGASLVQLKLSGPLIEGLITVLAEQPQLYPGLIADLAHRLAAQAGPEQIADILDELFELGFVVWHTPWPTNVPSLERRLAEYLATLPPAAGLAAVAEGFARIAALEEAYGAAPSPLRSLLEIDRLLDAVWQEEVQLPARAPLPPAVRRYRAKAGDLCEDVFLEPAKAPAAGSADALCQVSANTLRGILACVEPWVTVANLQGHRFDFLHTLGELMRERWPHGGEAGRRVGVLELFAACQSLWRDYRRFLAEGATAESGSGGDTASCSSLTCFNPLGLPSIEALRCLREELWRDIGKTLRTGETEQPICPAALRALVAGLPTAYAPAVGACLLLQPANAAQNLWVLNRMFEGTGRYGSRFTAVMSEPVRRRFAAAFTRGSRRSLPERELELLDLMWSRGDTLNVHAPMTRRVLELPGETLDLEPGRQLRLRDLAVEVDTESELPVLVDAFGRRLQPVHLGGAASRFLPSLVQFLALWGPGEWQPPAPPATIRRRGEVTVRERLTVGNVVVLRKRWFCPPAQLAAELAGLEDAAAFAVIHRWRGAMGIPPRVFWIERVCHPSIEEFYKPQYLDLTSPLFVALFRSALVADNGPLAFEEVLPAPEAWPADRDGRRWALELQLDTLALPPGAAAAQAAPICISNSYPGAMPVEIRSASGSER
jgi:hypothetical protein